VDTLGIYDALPGVTGLAQVQNIDMTIPELLVKIDKQRTEALNIKYILLTVNGVTVVMRYSRIYLSVIGTK
jgi:O-antigen biosynthesis protein WbqP